MSRQLPDGDAVFLDHVGHFVGDVAAAAAALRRAGFAPTPVSRQVHPGPERQPTGTGNVTCMLGRGYLEILFKTHDTALGRELDAALTRYGGVHLAAFAVADAAATHARLAGAGFRTRPLVRMERAVTTADGEGVAAFSVVRLQPGEMPEGRIQALTHHTEDTVWQPRWLSHPNGALALLDVVIAERDVTAAAARFARFLGRDAEVRPGGPWFGLERGGVQLCDAAALARLLPGLEVPSLPFMAGYGIAVASLTDTAAALARGGVDFGAGDGALTARFGRDLGHGAWVFVEDAAALPWRRR